MKNTSNSPAQEGNATKIERRKFMTGVALGAGLAPLAALSGTLRARATAPAAADLCFAPAKAVLSPSDFSYLGVFRMPAIEGHPMRWSPAYMTGRVVNGQARLIISGAIAHVDGYRASVHEVAIPGAFGQVVASAPRTTITASWADVWGGVPPGLQTGDPRLRGIHYDSDTDTLFWGYSADYAGQPHNPSLGAAKLAANGAVTSYGPWRTSTHSAAPCGYMLPIPPWFRPYVNGARLGIGNPPYVNNALASFGANLHAFNPPLLTEPPDSVSNSGDKAVTTKALLFHSMQQPQARGRNYITCDYTSGSQSQGQPWFGGANTAALLDWMDTCAWIDTPTKHGILFLGQLVDQVAAKPVPHNWYGGNPCKHGQTSVVHYATGPGAGTVASEVWIYSPDDLIAVAQGQKASHQIAPRSEFRVSAISSMAEECTVLYRFGGAWFDATTNRLYVTEAMATMDGNDPLPVVHVFQVS